MRPLDRTPAVPGVGHTPRAAVARLLMFSGPADHTRSLLVCTSEYALPCPTELRWTEHSRVSALPLLSNRLLQEDRLCALLAGS